MPQAETAIGSLWIIEDSAPLRSVLARMLEVHVQTIVEVENLAAFSQLLASGEMPDCIICDHDLGDGTAFDVAKLLPDHVQKLALTACQDVNLNKSLVAAGYAKTLLKPIKSAELRHYLDGLYQPAETQADCELPLALRQSYARFVAEETQAIANAYAKLDANRLKHHLHKLAGTASVYGDKALARAAASCEMRLHKGEKLDGLKTDLTELFENAGGPARLAC